ncbi:hypothetical protein WJX74_006225 [Apatococcus lobatus]|uniref:Uncharacterized protein n=1 Tax=Apatococcus lobatus TaxID=904363 RepID=A0AAW1QXL4_9CHLO
MRVGCWSLVACLLCLLICQAAAKAEESSAQVEGFTKEFGSLKGELQSRQSQLDETLKKVASVEAGDWNADGAKAILQDELNSAKQVLVAAEGKLEKVEEQLKGVLERALSADSSAGQAQTDLQGLRKDHEKVIKELGQQLAAAKATQGSTEDMLVRADKAEQLAKQLQDQLQSSEKTGSDKLAQIAGKLKDFEAKSQADLQAAAEQVTDFSSKLEAAGKQLEAAEANLKAAEKESSDTKTNLEQMLSKAEEATAQAQQLLQKSLEKWLPSWMETRYERMVAGIRPTLQQGWQATNQYTSGAQAQASDFYAKSRDYTSKTWNTYQPHVNRLSSDWKGGLLTRTSSLQKAAGPQLRAASQAVLRSTSSIRKQAERALSGPQVLKARRHLRKYFSAAQREFRKLRRDLERFFAGHMKRFPALVPYTKRPYISWITYALVVGPMLLVILPLLGGSGAKKSSTSGRNTGSQVSNPPAKATPTAAPSSSKTNKKEKGRRLTEGADSIRIP